DSSFGFEVIVCDYERDLRLPGYVFDPLFPSHQFIRLVQIVVAIGGCFGLEPLIVVAPMQAYVSDRRGHMRGWLERSSNLRRINIAEAHVAFGKICDRFGIVPRRVADFDDARILDEVAQQRFQILAIEGSVLERNWKLNEESPELSRAGKDVEAIAGQALIV